MTIVNKRGRYDPPPFQDCPRRPTNTLSMSLQHEWTWLVQVVKNLLDRFNSFITPLTGVFISRALTNKFRTEPVKRLHVLEIF